MWTYHQRSGKLTHDQQGQVAVGYSGAGQWKNDPASQHVPNRGPLPRGRYAILAPVASHGGFALPLQPDPANRMEGRSAFMVHGDSVTAPGTASEGCIILPRLIRWAMWGSGDRDLCVVE